MSEDETSLSDELDEAYSRLGPPPVIRSEDVSVLVEDTLAENARLRARASWLRRAYRLLHDNRHQAYRVIDQNYGLLREAETENTRLRAAVEFTAGQRDGHDRLRQEAEAERDRLRAALEDIRAAFLGTEPVHRDVVERALGALDGSGEGT